ncbi:ABC transporter substrate-binding protein [Thiobacter aerophilum]|uniref:ABC transporter substrate binding protein n=1 Tax=Thiobacter aerophilum TaxID=3121275 RepID=A0ABV0EF14_9BURK
MTILGLRWLVLLALTLCIVLPAAAAINLTVWLSDDTPPYQEFAQRLRRELQARAVHLEIQTGGAGSAQAELVVAVGLRATEQALRLNPSLPVLAVLLPRATYLQLRRSSGAQPFSAIFLDQPPARRFALIAEAFPYRKRVGAVLGPESAAELRSLQAAARERGLQLVSERIDDADALLPALNRVLSEADVLLAVPDPLVFNRNTAQGILLTSYRAQKPVVGYSQAYVNAGALLAVYSTPAQIARQTAELITALPSPSALPQPQYPRYFSVAVNAQVARSLGIPLEPERVLWEKLSKAGGEE